MPLGLWGRDRSHNSSAACASMTMATQTSAATFLALSSCSATLFYSESILRFTSWYSPDMMFRASASLPTYA
eukprot:3061041-Lingulodinium_polyedra.AAC.1